jgi:neopullulanase
MKIIKLFSFFILVNFICVKTIAQINHVEPLNWFIGMKNPNLQLLINGNNIDETTAQINYPGVMIKKINKADSKNYLFIDLLIAKTAKPGVMGISFKKDGKEVYNYKYELKKREQDAAQFKGFNSSDAIYLIVPDRFANGDYSNDVMEGLKEAFRVGDMAAIFVASSTTWII